MDPRTDPVSRMREFVLKVQQEGHLELVDDLMDADIVDHTAHTPQATQPGALTGRAAARGLLGALHAAFAEIRVEIQHIAAASDGVVMTHKVFRGRQVAPFHDRPATDQLMQMRIMDVVKFNKEGRMVEHWATTGGLEPVKE